MEEEVKQNQPILAKKLTHHPILVGFLHIFYGFITITALLSSWLAWNLYKGPVDATPIIPVLEKLMGNKERLQFRIGHMTLTWNSSSDPFAFHMQDVNLIGPRGPFMAIKNIDVGLSAWRLMLANLHFKYIKVQDMAVKITRLQDGAVTLTGIPDDEDKEKKAESVALQMDNIVNDLPSFEQFTLTDIRVIFEDQKDALIRRFDDVDMEIEQQRNLGKRSVSGYFTTDLTGAEDGSRATVDFIFDGNDKTLTASMHIENASTRKLFGGIMREANLPRIDMLVEGRAEFRLTNNFSLDDLTLRLKGEDGMLYWPRNYGQGLEKQKLSNFKLDAGYTPEKKELRLDNAEITIKGITLHTSGTLSAIEGWNKLKGDIRLGSPVIAIDALPAVWPKVWDSGARQWLVDRMDKGRIANLAVTVPFTATRYEVKSAIPEDGDAADNEPVYSWNIQNGTIKGSFDFTGVTVDYREPMLPVAETTGSGLYEGLSLTLAFTRAKIGKLDVKKGSLYFDDLITAGTGKADLNLSLQGPVASVFAYLEREPIAYRRKVDIDGTKGRGMADVELFATFPTTKDMRVEDVHVKASAKLQNLVMPNAVKGMTLAGDDFTLNATENHFEIEGTGTIDGRPATLSWTEYFDPKPDASFASRLDADISTDKALRLRFIGKSLEDRVDGTIQAKIKMLTKPDGKSELDIVANAADARIDLTNPFNAVKDKGGKADITLKATLQKNLIQSIDSLAIKGSGINLESGKISFARDSNNDPVLSTASLKNLRLGAIDATIEARWKNEYDITANLWGNSFDARYIMAGEDAANNSAGRKPPTAFDIKIKTGKLYIGDTPLENVDATFTGSPDGRIVKAYINGKAEGTTLKLAYDASGLSWQAANAGAALKALNVTDRVRGGTLEVKASPLANGQSGDMQGTLMIRDFSVVKAPALAKLVNLLSIPGLLNILTQDTGLKFTRAEADVTWLNKAGGALMVLSDGRTSGSSLGLTFEGEINMKSDTVAIQGTAIPMSEVNNLVSSIPLIGDILTGGKKNSGIFAATYTMKGPSSDPDVSVNPLSVLTPGILRRILFEGQTPKTDR